MLQQETSVWRHFDLWLTAAVMLLTAYGIMMIESAVTGAPAFEPLPGRQLLYAIVGLVVMVIFVVLLLAGLLYAWKRGLLRWV